MQGKSKGRPLRLLAPQHRGGKDHDRQRQQRHRPKGIIAMWMHMRALMRRERAGEQGEG